MGTACWIRSILSVSVILKMGFDDLPDHDRAQLVQFLHKGSLLPNSPSLHPEQDQWDVWWTSEGPGHDAHQAQRTVVESPALVETIPGRIVVGRSIDSAHANPFAVSIVHEPWNRLKEKLTRRDRSGPLRNRMRWEVCPMADT